MFHHLPLTFFYNYFETRSIDHFPFSRDGRVKNSFLVSEENGTYRYHLKDVIIGKIYFLLVRIKIKNMDLEIRRRESTGSGANTHVETETLAKYELMDGAPVRGLLPMLLFLKNYHYLMQGRIFVYKW